MKRSESIIEISKALSKFQGEVPNTKKNEDNPFFKSKYTPFDEVVSTIKTHLKNNNLGYIQSPLSAENGGVGLITLITHSSGEWIESDPLYTNIDKQTAQGVGSGITYLRRYQLTAMLGIASEEDDDGNKASGNKKEFKDDGKLINEVKVKVLQGLTEKKGMTEQYISSFKKKKSFKEFTEKEYAEAVRWLNTKQDKE